MTLRAVLRAKSVVTAAALTAGVFGGAISTAPSASAVSAYPTCDSYTTLVVGRFWAMIPIYNATGSNNCSMKIDTNRRNPAAWALQVSLKYCYVSNLATTTVYGPRTAAAVAKAQDAAGAGVDGIYGPETRNKIKWKWHPTSGDPQSWCINHP
jgi:hypothetical protein